MHNKVYCQFPSVRNVEVLQGVKNERTSYKQQKQGRLTGLVTSYIGNAA